MRQVDQLLPERTRSAMREQADEEVVLRRPVQDAPRGSRCIRR
jgi:hypothetical protein